MSVWRGAALEPTIVPTSDAAIVNSPNAATVANTISNALRIYDKNFSSFAVVPIGFQISKSVGGG